MTTLTPQRGIGIWAMSLVAAMTLAGLHGIFSSVTVLGINGVSIKKGCTSAVSTETSVNKAMIENSSGKVIIVADWLTPLAFCEELEATGVQVVRVPDEP